MTESVSLLYEFVETIKDIYPTAGILFPLKPTMTMLLGLVSVSGIPIHCNVEERIIFAPNLWLIKTWAKIDKNADYREVLYSQGDDECVIVRASTLLKSWLEKEIWLLAC